MKYLCLACGESRRFSTLSPESDPEQTATVERRRFGSAAPPGSVFSWRYPPSSSAVGVNDDASAPESFYCLVDAMDLDEAVRLIARTQWARSKQSIEVRPLTELLMAGADRRNE